jgi:hypothetical protein
MKPTILSTRKGQAVLAVLVVAAGLAFVGKITGAEYLTYSKELLMTLLGAHALQQAAGSYAQASVVKAAMTPAAQPAQAQTVNVDAHGTGQ